MVCTPIHDDRAGRRGRPRPRRRARSSPRSGASWARCPEQVIAHAASEDLPRYVPGHPMGGSERSGPRARLAVGPRRDRLGDLADGGVRSRRRPGPRDLDRGPGRESRPHARRSSRPARGLREPSPAGGVDRVDESRRDGRGRRAGDPPAGGRRLPGPHASRRLRRRIVVLDPAREPRADRRGDRPLRRSPPEPAGGRRREPRRRGAIDVRAGEGGSSPPRRPSHR